MPIRTGNSSARCAATAASTADSRRREGRAHAVAGVLEQPTVVRVNGFAQQLVVSSERGPHRVRVGLPPPGRPLDVGEQERDDSRGAPRSWRATRGRGRAPVDLLEGVGRHRRVGHRSPLRGERLVGLVAEYVAQMRDRRRRSRERPRVATDRGESGDGRGRFVMAEPIEEDGEDRQRAGMSKKLPES